MKSKLTLLLAFVLITSIILGACSTAATTTVAPTKAPEATKAVEPTATTAPEATKAPEATTAPTSAPTATSVPDEWGSVDPSGQTITFWHQQTKSKEAALKAIADEFNATNAYKITVVPVYSGSYSEIFNKMLPILNTADVPDLVVAYQNQAATYQISGALLDMTSLVNSPKWGVKKEQADDIFPSFFAQDVFPTFGNARLGFPPNRSLEVMFYNIDWLKELGYNEPPTTPEQFKEMACKASQTPFSKATGKSKPMGFELSIDTSRLASWTFSFGGDIYDYANNKFTLNSDAAVNSMKFMQDLFVNGCAALPAEAYGDQTDFGNGTLLFAIGSTSGLTYYDAAVKAGAKFAWSVAAMPHTTADPQVNIYGASVSMPKTTPERELATWIFVKYFTTTEVQAKWSIASGYFPVVKSAEPLLADFFTANPGMKAVYSLIPYGKFEPPVPGYDFVREKVNLALAEIADAKGPDPKGVLDALNEEANKILAEQLAQIK